MILANIIYILHALVVVFLVVAPFTSSDLAHLLHAVAVPGLVVHWALNQDVCFLTYLESVLRGVPITETFLDRLVGAFYRIPADLHLGQRATYVALLLWLVTLYRLRSGGGLRRFLDQASAVLGAEEAPLPEAAKVAGPALGRQHSVAARALSVDALPEVGDAALDAIL